MHIKVFSAMVFVSFALTMVGCHSPSNPTPTSTTRPLTSDSFDEAIGIPDMNRSIIVFAPPDLNGFKTSSWIEVVIQNQSDKTVWFPVDFGRRIWLFSDETQLWAEIKDRAVVETPVNLSVTEILLTPAQMELTSVIPDITSPAKTRIMIVGKIYENGQPTEQEVAGYVDVVLQP